MNEKSETIAALGEALQSLTWEEMDNFAEYVVDSAVDDNGGPNDVRYVARCLLDWAKR